MKKILMIGLVIVFSLGFSINYVKGMARAEEEGKVVVDRICKMQIDIASAETLTKDGHTYYFCSNHCKTTFANSPEEYACICPQLHEGCNCGHCTGNGTPCICAEAGAGAQKGEHKHEGHNH